MICKHCGKEIKDDAKVCRYCGRAVRHAGKKYKRVKARPAASLQEAPQHKRDGAKETDENKPQKPKTQQGAQEHKKQTHSSGNVHTDAKTKKPAAEKKASRQDSHTAEKSRPKTEQKLAAQDKPRTKQAPAGDHHRAKTRKESAKEASPAKSSSWAVLVGCLLVGCAIIFAALILGLPEDAPEDTAEPAVSNSVTETEQQSRQQADEIREALEAAALRESNGIKIVEDSQFDADICEIADTVAEDAEKYLASYEQGGYLYMSLAETLKSKYTDDVSANISAVFRIEQGDVEQMISRIDDAAGEDSASEYIETFYEQSGGIAVKVHYSVYGVADDIWVIGTYIYV